MRNPCVAAVHSDFSELVNKRRRRGVNDVAGHGDGESRFVESEAVTTKLQSTLHLFDLIVGTEEEFHTRACGHAEPPTPPAEYFSTLYYLAVVVFQPRSWI